MYGTRRHARHRSSAEPHVQLPIHRATSAKGPSPAVDTGHGGRSSGTAVSVVREDLRPRGTTIDCAGETATGAVAADVVFDPERAVIDGGDRLQCAVPLVRGNESGRGSVGRDHLQQEPGAALGGGGSQGVFGAGGGAGASSRT